MTEIRPRFNIVGYIKNIAITGILLLGFSLAALYITGKIVSFILEMKFGNLFIDFFKSYMSTVLIISTLLLVIYAFSIVIDLEGKFKFDNEIPYTVNKMFNASVIIYSNDGFEIKLNSRADNKTITDFLDKINKESVKFKYNINNTYTDSMRISIHALNKGSI